MTSDSGSGSGADATPPYVVRPATPRDVPSFLSMWRAVVAEQRYVRSDSVTRSARFYRKMFRRSWTADQVVLVADEGDRMIGQLVASREESPINKHVASIGMAVAADRRNRGVGSALMAEALRWGRAVGVEKLALSVYPDNDAARALYRKFGFVEEGRLSGHSKKAIGYRDEIVMACWLIDLPPGVSAGPSRPG